MQNSESSTGEIDRQFLVEMEGAAPAGVYVSRDPGLAVWEHDRIIITRAMYRDMFHDNPEDFGYMISLYLFYYEAGRRQKTNQPWAVDKFAMKGLGWSKDFFYRIKKKLMEQGFIEKKAKRDKGKIVKWFVKVNFMSSVNQSPTGQDCGEATRVLPEPPVVQTNTNALIHQHEMLKDNNKQTAVVVMSRIYGKLKIPHERLNNDYNDKDLQNAVDLLDTKENVKNPIGFLIEAIEKKWKLEEEPIIDTRLEDTQRYLRNQENIKMEISKQSTGIVDSGIQGLWEEVNKNGNREV